MDKLMRFLKDEEGASMVEYGLLVALIAIVAIVGVNQLGPAIRDIFQDAADELGAAS